MEADNLSFLASINLSTGAKVRADSIHFVPSWHGRLLLNSYKFYSLADKLKYLKEPAKLSIHDQRAQEEIAKVIARLQHLSNIDVQYTNEIFNLFVQNLEWDHSFMLFLMAMPFNKLGSVSYASKKELLSKIKTLIQEECQKPNEGKKFDKYELD